MYYFDKGYLIDEDTRLIDIPSDIDLEHDLYVKQRSEFIFKILKGIKSFDEIDLFIIRNCLMRDRFTLTDVSNYYKIRYESVRTRQAKIIRHLRTYYKYLEQLY